MSEPFDPDLLIELASARLDDELTDAELSAVVGDPEIAAVSEIDAVSEAFRRNRDLLSTDPGPVADEFTRSRHLRAALAAYDDLRIEDQHIEDQHIEEQDAAPVVVGINSRRARGIPTWLSVAAGVVIALGGIGFALQLGNGGSDSGFDESADGGAELATESTMADAGDASMESMTDSAASAETAPAADAETTEEAMSDDEGDDAADADAPSEGFAPRNFDNLPDSIDPTRPLTADDAALALTSDDDLAAVATAEVNENGGTNLYDLSSSFCMTSGGFDEATAGADLTGPPVAYLPVTIDDVPVELILLDNQPDGFPPVALTSTCDLWAGGRADG